MHEVIWGLAFATLISVFLMSLALAYTVNLTKTGMPFFRRLLIAESTVMILYIVGVVSSFATAVRAFELGDEWAGYTMEALAYRVLILTVMPLVGSITFLWITRQACKDFDERLRQV